MRTDELQTLRTRIKSRLAEHNMSQAHLSKGIGRNASYIFDLLEAKATQITDEEIKRAAEVLDCDAEWLRGRT